MDRAGTLIGSLNVGWYNPSGLLCEQSIPGFVTSENANRLLQLHAIQDPAGKAQLVANLNLQLNALNGGDRAHLAFLVLHRLGHSLEALTRIVELKNVSHRPRGLDSIMIVFAALLATEYSTMSVEWCQSAQRILQGQLRQNTIVRDRLNQILLRFVDAELVDANPEIYADRDKVISIWDRNFDDKNVVRLIEEIDQYFRDGERSETAFATCVGRLRVLLVAACRAIVERAAQEGKKPLRPDADEKYLLQHLEAINLVNKPELNLLGSLRDLASIGGAHALDARIEDARLVKNMTYEVLLLLLSRTPGLTR